MRREGSGGEKRKIKNLLESKWGETRQNTNKCKSLEDAVDSRFSNHVQLLPRKLILGWINKNMVQRKGVKIFQLDFVAIRSHTVVGGVLF